MKTYALRPPLAFAAGAGLAVAYAVLLSAFVLLDVSVAADLDTLYFCMLLFGWMIVLAAGFLWIIEGAWRRDAPRCAFGGGALLGGLLLLILLPRYATGWWLYRAQVTVVAERGRPLVEAITRYEADHGAAPSGFGDLVPKYLPNGVPDPGQGEAWPFHYYPPDPSTGLAWRIGAPTPMPVLSFDGLYYTPTGDYKWLEGAGSVERFGEWGYLHE